MSFTGRRASAALLSLSAVVLVGLVGCTQKKHDLDANAFYGSVFDDAKTFDPANAYDEYSVQFAANVYETLYQYAYLAKTYEVVPLLAADMPKYSADKLTITIPLRHDIHYAADPIFKLPDGKGRVVTAPDFIFGIKRLANPRINSSGWWTVDGKIVGINAFHDKLLKAEKTDFAKSFAGPVEGLQALDDFTLQIKLTKPYPQLPFILAMSFTAPIAPEAFAAYADEKGNLNEHPVGTGAYVVKEWARNRRLVFERNHDFHSEFYPSSGDDEFRKKGLLADSGKRLPFLDRLEFSIIREEQPSWLSFMHGDLDRMTIPKDNFTSAINNQVNLQPELSSKGIRLSIDPGVTYFFVAFNMKDKLVGSNKLLRQAFSCAIDRDRWIEIFTNGRGKKQTNTLPIGTPGRPDGATLKYDYNLARAKHLLKQAGFPEGRGLPALRFDMRAADSTSRQMGDFFQRELGKIGIKLEVIYNTFPAFLEKTKKSDLQVYYGGWSLDYPDAENAYQILYGPNRAPGPNEVSFDNPEFNQLYEKMSVLETGPARTAMIQRMDDIVQEEAPWALGYYAADYHLSQPWLLNYRPSRILNNTFKYYRIDREIKRRYLEAKGG